MIRNGTAIVLHRNWKGLVTFATDDAGDPTTCAPDLGTGCDLVSFPGVTWGATLLHPDAMDTETWYGTVPMGFMDKTGLIYRRNRYYDPSSEQFTQPDPIGMAGGLGIYAYVGGDPVNGGDPFGLSDTPVVPDSCDHYPYAFQCGGGGVPWGLQGADRGQQVIDLCQVDEQACRRKGGGDLCEKYYGSDYASGQRWAACKRGQYLPAVSPPSNRSCGVELGVAVVGTVVDVAGVRELAVGGWALVSVGADVSADAIRGFMGLMTHGVPEETAARAARLGPDLAVATGESGTVAAAGAAATGSSLGLLDLIPYVGTGRAWMAYAGCR